MANLAEAAHRVLEHGAVTFRPHGNSMTPLIKSGQQVTVVRMAGEPHPGEIVLCKVHGAYRLHLVTAVDIRKRQVQISNNHGHVNGWCSFDQVYGIVL